MNITKMTIETTPETAAKIAQLLANEGTAEQQPALAVPQPTVTAIPQNAPAVPQYSIPVQQPVQQPVQTAPVMPQPTAPAAPTTAPSYTIAQLQAACAPLADAGKLPALQQLISTFGVASLSELPPARYGEFANGLRALGGVL